jgi:hypothetical protein
VVALVENDGPCPFVVEVHSLGNPENLQTGHNSLLSFSCRPPVQLADAANAKGFMISLAILSLLAGAVLGWWFTVPVLVLAIMLAAVVVAGAGAAVVSLWWIALDVFVVTMCLQLGYGAGSALAACLGQRRAPREPRRAANASSRAATTLITDGREKPRSAESLASTILRMALSCVGQPLLCQLEQHFTLLRLLGLPSGLHAVVCKPLI